MPNLLDALPSLYGNLLPELFAKGIPAEAKATCANCAMCQPRDDGESPSSAVEAVDGQNRFFKPDTKCCTYHPRLPNYLVGALLADSSAEMAEGRRRMEEKIASGIGLTPQWLRAPAKYSLLYANQRTAFGRASSLL